VSTKSEKSDSASGENRADLGRSVPMPKVPVPRLRPLVAEEWEEPARTVLTADLGDGSPLGARHLSELRVFTTLARHPKLFAPWMMFARRLLVKAHLTAADRELLILRTAYNCRADYEWGQHTVLARHAGLSDVDIERSLVGADAPGWQDRQRLLLTAADELHRESAISDATWKGLSEHLSEKALIEVPVLVGHYVMLAYALNSFRVVPEDGLDALPER
jgi:4-carboxymuconolactone decarboxylase